MKEEKRVEWMIAHSEGLTVQANKLVIVYGDRWCERVMECISSYYWSYRSLANASKKPGLLSRFTITVFHHHR